MQSKRRPPWKVYSIYTARFNTCTVRSSRRPTFPVVKFILFARLCALHITRIFPGLFRRVNYTNERLRYNLIALRTQNMCRTVLNYQMSWVRFLKQSPFPFLHASHIFRCVDLEASLPVALRAILCVGIRRLLVQMHARTQRCYRWRSGRVKCRAFTRGARLRLRTLLRGVQSRATVKPRCALSYLPNVFAQESREIEAVLVRKRTQQALRDFHDV